MASKFDQLTNPNLENISQDELSSGRENGIPNFDPDEALRLRNEYSNFKPDSETAIQNLNDTANVLIATLDNIADLQKPEEAIQQCTQQLLFDAEDLRENDENAFNQYKPVLAQNLDNILTTLNSTLDKTPQAQFYLLDAMKSFKYIANALGVSIENAELSPSYTSESLINGKELNIIAEKLNNEDEVTISEKIAAYKKILYDELTQRPADISLEDIDDIKESFDDFRSILQQQANNAPLTEIVLTQILPMIHSAMLHAQANDLRNKSKEANISPSNEEFQKNVSAKDDFIQICEGLKLQGLQIIDFYNNLSATDDQLDEYISQQILEFQDPNASFIDLTLHLRNTPQSTTSKAAKKLKRIQENHQLSPNQLTLLNLLENQNHPSKGKYDLAELDELAQQDQNAEAFAQFSLTCLEDYLELNSKKGSKDISKIEGIAYAKRRIGLRQLAKEKGPEFINDQLDGDLEPNYKIELYCTILDTAKPHSPDYDKAINGIVQLIFDDIISKIKKTEQDTDNDDPEKENIKSYSTFNLELPNDIKDIIYTKVSTALKEEQAHGLLSDPSHSLNPKEQDDQILYKNLASVGHIIGSVQKKRKNEKEMADELNKIAQRAEISKDQLVQNILKVRREISNHDWKDEHVLQLKKTRIDQLLNTIDPKTFTYEYFKTLNNSPEETTDKGPENNRVLFNNIGSQDLIITEKTRHGTTHSTILIRQSSGDESPITFTSSLEEAKSQIAASLKEHSQTQKTADKQATDNNERSLDDSSTYAKAGTSTDPSREDTSQTEAKSDVPTPNTPETATTPETEQLHDPTTDFFEKKNHAYAQVIDFIEAKDQKSLYYSLEADGPKAALNDNSELCVTGNGKLFNNENQLVGLSVEGQKFFIRNPDQLEQLIRTSNGSIEDIPQSTLANLLLNEEEYKKLKNKQENQNIDNSENDIDNALNPNSSEEIKGQSVAERKKNIYNTERPKEQERIFTLESCFDKLNDAISNNPVIDRLRTIMTTSNSGHFDVNSFFERAANNGTQINSLQILAASNQIERIVPEAVTRVGESNTSVSTEAEAAARDQREFITALKSALKAVEAEGYRRLGMYEEATQSAQESQSLANGITGSNRVGEDHSNDSQTPHISNPVQDIARSIAGDSSAQSRLIENLAKPPQKYK